MRQVLLRVCPQTSGSAGERDLTSADCDSANDASLQQIQIRSRAMQLMLGRQWKDVSVEFAAMLLLRTL